MNLDIKMDDETRDLANRGIEALQELTKALVAFTCLVRELRPGKAEAVHPEKPGSA